MSLFLGDDKNGNPLLHITKDDRQSVDAINSGPDSNSTFHSSLPYVNIEKTVDIPRSSFSFMRVRSIPGPSPRTDRDVEYYSALRISVRSLVDLQSHIREGKTYMMMFDINGSLYQASPYYFQINEIGIFGYYGSVVSETLQFYISRDPSGRPDRDASVILPGVAGNPDLFSLRDTSGFLYVVGTDLHLFRGIKLYLLNIDVSGRVSSAIDGSSGIEVSGEDFVVGGFSINNYNYIQSDTSNDSREKIPHSVCGVSKPPPPLIGGDGSVRSGGGIVRRHGYISFNNLLRGSSVSSASGSTVHKPAFNPFFTSIVRPSTTGGWSINSTSISKNNDALWSVGKVSKFTVLGTDTFSFSGIAPVSTRNSNRVTRSITIPPDATSIFVLFSTGSSNIIFLYPKINGDIIIPISRSYAVAGPFGPGPEQLIFGGSVTYITITRSQIIFDSERAVEIGLETGVGSVDINFSYNMTGRLIYLR